MSHVNTICLKTSCEKFYSITQEIESGLSTILKQCQSKSGVLIVFNPHTSCALTISESYDESARLDMENFLKHLAPRNLHFIKHTAEGPDDSPSHMKSILLQPSLNLIVDQGQLLLGTWQGIYLCEFRDSPKQRKLHLKFCPDL